MIWATVAVMTLALTCVTPRDKAMSCKLQEALLGEVTRHGFRLVIVDDTLDAG